MDILDDKGVSKLSAKVIWKVNYYFKGVWTVFKLKLLLEKNTFVSFDFLFKT